MTAVDARLTAALAGGRYALVGAGQLGAMSLALWPSSGAPPEFFLDSRKTGSLNGIEIRDLASHVRVPGVTYLASAFAMPARELKDIFRKIGQDDIVTVYDIFDASIPTVFTNGWRNLAPDAATLARCARLPPLYADETSRRNAEAVAAWRYRREFVDDYPVEPETNKYDLRHFERAGVHYDVVYDCGSFDLGLLRRLADADIAFDRVIAFEPDPARLAVCRQQAAAWTAERGGHVTPDPRAVSDHVARGAFLASGLLAARLIGDPTFDHPDVITVETCTLDAVHENVFGWTDGSAPRVLIKLHVEGAEPAALRGAQRLIRQCRADVLVNLSHDEESLLDVPEVLAGFGCYDLFLRSYALFGEGLTLFARHRS